MSKEIKTNVCRMCMASNVALVGIFDCVNRDLAEDIQFCTGIQVQKSDGLPKKICKDCLSQLKSTYQFKRKCLKTNKKLNNLYSLQIGLNKTQIKKEVRKHLLSDVKNEKPISLSSRKVKQESQKLNVKIEVEIKGERLEISKSEINETEDFVDDCHSPQSVKPEAEYEVREQNNIDESFKTVSKRVKEKKIYNRRDEVICEVCGIKVVGTCAIWRHNKMHKPPEFHCDQCGYQTWFRDEMEKHVQTHSEKKQFQCSYCPRMFNFLCNLNDHTRRIHEKDGVRKYKCTVCSATYRDRHGLKSHTMHHLNERNFECSLCNSRFNIRRYLKDHLRKTHNVILPHIRRGRRRNTGFLQTTLDGGSSEAALQ